MNITITDITGEYEYIMPHVPADIEHGGACDNTSINTLDGNIRVMGDIQLKTVSWTGILPVNKNYSWQKYGSLLDGYEYIKFFESMMANKLPVRVVITDSDDISLLNSLMSIDSFNYHKDRAKDFTYTIVLTEFPEDKWDYLNDYIENLDVYSELAAKSAAKKELEKDGLI